MSVACELEDGVKGMVTGGLLGKINWLDVKQKVEVWGLDGAVGADLADGAGDVVDGQAVDGFKQMAGWC